MSLIHFRWQIYDQMYNNLVHWLYMRLHHCHVWNTRHWTDSEFAWTLSCLNTYVGALYIFYTHLGLYVMFVLLLLFVSWMIDYWQAAGRVIKQVFPFLKLPFHHRRRTTVYSCDRNVLWVVARSEWMSRLPLHEQRVVIYATFPTHRMSSWRSSSDVMTNYVTIAAAALLRPSVSASISVPGRLWSPRVASVVHSHCSWPHITVLGLSMTSTTLSSLHLITDAHYLTLKLVTVLWGWLIGL